MPTILRIYSNHQSNLVLCDVIEFTCRQFFIMHREPFILQVFVCVSDFLKVCLHVTSLTSCPSKSPSTFNIVSMARDMLTGKMSYTLILYYTVDVWVCGRDPKHPWGPHSGGLYEGVLYCIVDVWVCGRDPKHPWGPLSGGLYEGEHPGAVPAAAGARTRLPRHPRHPGPPGGRKTTRRSGNNVRLLVYSKMSKKMQHWTLLARSEDRSLGPAYNEWNYTKELVLVTKFYDRLLVARVLCIAVLIIRGTQCNYFQENSRNDSHSEIQQNIYQKVTFAKNFGRNIQQSQIGDVTKFFGHKREMSAQRRFNCTNNLAMRS